MDNYSLSDLRAAVGDDNGAFGGNGAWWVILLFLFWGFNGNGWNRQGEFGQYATAASQQVDAGTKRKAVRDAFSRWKSWETDTKKLYEQAYADLHELGEISAACEVKKLVQSVDCELERVERQRINLECLDYELSAICAEQDRLLTRYSPNYGVVTA